jgi:hypothetical protein
MDLFVVLVLAFANTKTFVSILKKKLFSFFFKNSKKKMTIQKKNVIIKKNGDMAEW